VFFIRYVSDAIFAIIFLPKPPADRRRPQCEKYCSNLTYLA